MILGVASAGLLRHAGQPGVGHLVQQGLLHRAKPDARRLALPGAAAHPDAVDHGVVPARPVDHLALADRLVLEVERLVVLAVAEHQDRRPLLALFLERGESRIHRPPQRCRRVGLDDIGQRLTQRADVTRELLADDDVGAEAADAHTIVGAQAGEQLVRRIPQQRQVPLHAAGDIQQQHQPDRLRSVVEQCDRLRRPFVADLELVLREVGHQPAVLVQHGDEHAHEVRGAPEHRLLLRGRADHSHGQHAHRHDRGEPSHSTLAVRHWHRLPSLLVTGRSLTGPARLARDRTDLDLACGCDGGRRASPGVLDSRSPRVG